MQIRVKSLVQALLGALLVTAVAAPLSGQNIPGAQDSPGVVIDEVIVRGNQRVDTNAIRAIAVLQPGQRVTGTDIQSAIRRLMGTGQYETVDIRPEGTPGTGLSVVIEVVERPLISAFDIVGLQRIGTSAVPIRWG